MPPRTAIHKVIRETAKNPNEANQILKNRKTIQIPNSDAPQIYTIHKYIDSVYSPKAYGTVKEVPEISDARVNLFNEKLRQRIAQCKTMTTYKEYIKLIYMKEISDLLSEQKYYQILEKKTFKYLFAMIKANIVRAIPPYIEPITMKENEEIEFHNSDKFSFHPYEIFYQIVKSPFLDKQKVDKYIDKSLIYQILALLSSPDRLEREYLVKIIYSIYIKFFDKRQLICNAMKHTFLTFLYETRKYYGIEELLCLMNPIINGLVFPLKKEYVDFLTDVILPLLTSQYLQKFIMAFGICLMSYIDIDSSLIPVIVRSLLKFWPVSNIRKELYFIDLISKIIEKMTEEQFADLMVELCTKIGKCISSESFQVSEKAMLLWRDDKFLYLVTKHAEKLYRIILPHLIEASSKHWEIAIRNLAVSVIKVCIKYFPDASKLIKEKKEAKKDESWELIIKESKVNNFELNLNENIVRYEDIFSGET